jgi:hypothetical protein
MRIVEQPEPRSGAEPGDILTRDLPSRRSTLVVSARTPV